jgi:hypothetical protein
MGKLVNRVFALEPPQRAHSLGRVPELCGLEPICRGRKAPRLGWPSVVHERVQGALTWALWTWTCPAT